MRQKIALLVFGFALLAGKVAHADVILAKPLNTTGYGWNSNVPLNRQQSTDDVLLNTATTIDTIQWYGFVGGGTTSFRIRFFDNAAEFAVTTPFYEDDVVATAVDTGIDHFGNDVFLYTADITNVNLAANTRYDMSIMSLMAATWTWNFSNLEGGSAALLYHRDGDLDDWRQVGGNSHAFTLNGFVSEVPEPASLALWGIAALGLGWAGHRRARR